MNSQSSASSATPASSREGSLAPAENLLRKIIQAAGLQLEFSARREAAPEGLEIVLDFSGPDSDLLLEGNGTLLDALEYVAQGAVRLEERHEGRLQLDCQGYRAVRAEELKLTARLAAERVIETGTPFPLSPMNPRDRRVVHLALREERRVRTESQGFGAERKVVIYPA